MFQDKWKGRDVLSITTDPSLGRGDYFSREDFEKLFALASRLNGTTSELLKGKKMVSLFYENSSRTRLSFDSAMKSLGGEVIDYGDVSRSSMNKKDESFTDSLLTLEGYCDVIVMRHPLNGAPRWAAEILDIPVINAGDGSRQHPTQTMIDLFTIYELTKGKIDGSSIALVGDSKYGRTVKSLFRSLSLFDNIKVTLVSPPQLSMSQEEISEAKVAGLQVETAGSLKELTSIDFIYMTRMQKERFEEVEFKKLIGSYRLDSALAKQLGTYIMHPLPIDKTNPEIEPELTFSYDKAIYHSVQEKNGVPVRMALLGLVLEGEKFGK